MDERLVCTLCYTYGCHLNKSKLLPATLKYDEVHIPTIQEFLLITTYTVQGFMQDFFLGGECLCAGKLISCGHRAAAS